MKKLYSLLKTVVSAAIISAQGAEKFGTQTVLSTTYANGTFSGESAGVTVNF